MNCELNLLHPRSMAAVIRDGYRLYMGSFKKLFRSSWIVAIVYAIAFALLMGHVVNNVVPMQAVIRAFGPEAVVADPSYASTSLMSLLTSLFFVVAALLLAAQGIHAFCEHQQTNTISRPAHWYGRFCLPSFVRLLPVTLWLAVLSVIISAVFSAVVYGILALGVVGNVWKSIASFCLLALLAIIVMALLVPLAYTVMRKLLVPSSQGGGSKLPPLSSLLFPPVKGYGRGLRHWGLLFATLFVVYIFTALLTLVCELPAVIIIVANTEAYAGLALGDPLGMPENIVPMTYCVFTLAGFIQAYVHLSTLFPLYYAYGSIEQQEAERMNL
jgi:hypothetical protein